MRGFYDIKVLDKGAEQETIRGLTTAQAITLVHVLRRGNIEHLVKRYKIEGDTPVLEGYGLEEKTNKPANGC